MTLFQERGWTAIINDSLILRVLHLMSFVIGALTGVVGILLAAVHPGWVEQFGSSSTAVAFFLPFVIGTAMAYILMSVVASAVDTVVVAFAEAPLEFERNHPGLSQQMVSAWRQVYPEEFGR
jgi:ABC-type polysaccharide transport system permease subunit